MSLMDLMGPQMMRPHPRAANQRFMPYGQPGGYDSSGINPRGMYNGRFNQPQMPQFPANPGGFQPMGLAGLMRRY